MKIGIFSDMHLKYVGDKIEGMDALDKIVDFFLKEKVDGIIFNGDLFEKRYMFHFKLLYELVGILLKLKDMSFLVFNIGNHDLYEKTGENALKFLSLLDNVTLIEKPSSSDSLEFSNVKGEYVIFSVKADPTDVLQGCKFFPYRKEPTKDELEFLKEGGEILFAHQYMDIKEEAVIEPQEFVLDKKILKKYNMVFTGHYHIPFAIEKPCNIVNLGSARSIDFKDAEGKDRYIYIWDTKKKSFKEYDLDFPKHVKVAIGNKKGRDEFLENMNDKDHYQITISDKLVNKDLEEKENVTLKRELEEYKTESRLDIGDGFEIDEILRKYTEMVLTGPDFNFKWKDNVDKFIEKGKEILKEAENV